MIELSADGSDENEHDLTYQWFFNDLEISEASQDNSFSYEVEDQGLYEFVVRVCDCYTCTDLNVVAEVGEEQNAAPIANAGQDRVVELSGYWSCSEESCEFIYEVDNLILDGLENSSDSEGDPLTYTWTKVGGPDAEFEYLDDSSISVTVPKPESLDNIELIFELEVVDSYSDYSVDNISVVINSLYKESSIDILEGTYLYSLDVMENDMNVGSVFEDLVSINSHKIVSQGRVAFWNGDQWLGSLQEVDPREGYWILSPDDLDNNELEVIGSIENVGIPYDCSIEYDLTYGANLISYTGSAQALDINDAIPMDQYPEFYDCPGDKSIINSGSAAHYDPILGWVGSLEEIKANEGYWIKTCAPFTFNWSCEEDLSARVSNMSSEIVDRYPDGFDYAQSMQQAFYFIKDAKVNGEDLDENAWIIAYNNNVVVGARKWNGAFTDVPFMGYDNTDRTLGYGQMGDVPKFKVYYPSTGELVDMDASEVSSWSNNSLAFVDNLSATTESLVPTDIVLENAYPNPFNPSTRIAFSVPSDMHVDLSIYDINGRMVEQLINDVKLAGSHDINWDASMNASGVYFIRFNADGNMHTQKILLVK